MEDFYGWLVSEERQGLVSQSVLQTYELEFKRSLYGLIQRTQDPVLREKFQEMLDCPIRDSRGACRSFTDYILSALLRNGVHQTNDIEAALGYVYEQLMSDKSLTTGQPKDTVFSTFDEKRPFTPGSNPLQGKFMSWLTFAVRNIRKGKIPRLSNVERRPQGTVSIGQGRPKEGDLGGEIPPDQIAARRSTDADLTEMINDITDLLKHRQLAFPDHPLVDLFQSIVRGERADKQVAQFGDRPTRAARQIIVQVIKSYAESSGNYRLLSMLQRYDGFQSNKPMPVTRKPAPVIKPVLAPGKEKDFISIISVIDRLGGRPASSADFGKYRRRWLEYQPRDPSSGHKNRLQEVLTLMVQEKVLRPITSPQGAVLYVPGENYEKYRQMASGPMAAV